MRRGWVLYLAAGGGITLAYFFLPPVARSGPMFNVIGLTSVVAIVTGTRLNRPSRRLPWYLFALGQALFVAGDVLAYNYQRFFHAELPFPSVADLLYLGVYPSLVAGTLMLIRRQNPGRDRAGLIDSLILTVGAGVLSWVYLMAPYAHDTSLSLFTKLISLGYPLMDLLLLAVAARLMVGAGRREPAFFLMFASVVALLSTDSVYGWLLLHGGYETGGWLDAGWAVFYVLWGAAALHPSMRSLSEPTADAEPRLGRTRLVLLAGATLVGPVIQLVQAGLGRRVDVPVMAGASISLFLLVVARMSGLLRRHGEAEARERALRQAAQAFVAAGGREGVFGAAGDAVVALAGSDGPVRVVEVAEDSGRLVVRVPGSPGAASGPTQGASSGSPGAASGPTPDTRSGPTPGSPGTLSDLPPAVLHRLMDRDVVEWADLPPPVRRMLGLDGEPFAVLAPVVVRDRLAGLLVLGSGTVSRAVRAGLDTLASQAALALEGAALSQDLARRQSEARFRSLVLNSSDVMTVMDPDSTIRYQSPSIRRVLGHDPEDLVGTPLLHLIHPDDRGRLVGMLADGNDGTDRPQLIECRWRHLDGSWLHVETLRTDLTADPNVAGVVLNSRDVSERKAFEEQLSHQAFHDSITGLANRALFRDRVEHALQRQARDSGSIAVLFLDLDDFKTVNDSLGHAAGDELLALVAERLLRSVRTADTAARLGGDEFAILLEDAEYDHAAEVATRFLRILEAPFVVEDKEVFVRASIGIAIGGSGRSGPAGVEELLRSADTAMYMAKGQGKGRYQVFEPTMHASVLRRLEMKAELQRACEHGEFVLHYQPIVELATGRITGVEALVRWQHPQRGLIPPGEFIPLAEETGLIVQIGRWVLREACREAIALQAKLQAGPPLTVAVNISARQLQHPGLVGEVAETLRETGLIPATLILEITESVMMADTELSIHRLAELKRLGIQLAVDDFGTGYSSLNYIRQFPLDILKVDKSFIDGVNEDGEVSALTAAIIDLAGTLNLKPVAEGIEQTEQLARLLELRCALGQGFYFARPLDRAAIEDLVERHGAERGRSGPSELEAARTGLR